MLTESPGSRRGWRAAVRSWLVTLARSFLIYSAPDDSLSPYWDGLSRRVGSQDDGAQITDWELWLCAWREWEW